jgi:mRNA interferase YafQ
MLSTRKTDDKRVRLPRTSSYTKQFVKDWRRFYRSARFDLQRLKTVMLLIISADGPLPPEWKDHHLVGNWFGHRECHVGGDFLLIYRIDDTDPGAVVFVRTGTHADLFE